MKRTRTIVAVAALALALPALALAERTNHLGHLVDARGAQVKFKERVSGGEAEVSSFAVRDFEVGCRGGTVAMLKVAKLSGSVEISERGRFKVRDDNGRTTFKVKGEINRNKSVGTFRYSGKVAGGGGRNCDSGRLDWVTRP